jgi:hypothetical protein
MFRLIIPAALLLVGSAALSADSYRQREEARDNADLAKALAGYTPGKPMTCIETTRIRDTQRVGDKIIYKYSSREMYVNDTGGGCFGLRSGDAIITKSYTGQFCRGDIVRTADLTTHTPSGSCAFGDFVPYRK